MNRMLLIWWNKAIVSRNPENNNISGIETDHIWIGGKMKILYCGLLLLLTVFLNCNNDFSINSDINNVAVINDNISNVITADSDAFTERNIYLDAIVEWNPGLTGAARANYVIVEDSLPVKNDLAFGGPTGNGCGSRVYSCVCVGINGSAAFRFEEGFYIYNGDGYDFTTFEGSFAWGGAVDGLCCELAHVEVSEDLITWYYNSAEEYDINPDPTEDNGDYCHANVKGLHGNNPTWANINQDMQAYEIKNGKWTAIEDVYVSKDFKPTDPYLGGDSFDLFTFRSKTDDSPWPDEGKMRYVRIIDDDSIIDGQGYSNGWCFGAQMHAAMGINVKTDTELATEEN
ncbi:MAG: hypothetical protein JW864_18040 [Spirochaetes bacterium]|nr:hypothetical protein [Spirochaetota bacterium]